MDNHEPDMDKIGINLQHPATKLMELFFPQVFDNIKYIEPGFLLAVSSNAFLIVPMPIFKAI